MDVTRLLQAAGDGDQQAREELAPVVKRDWRVASAWLYGKKGPAQRPATP